MVPALRCYQQSQPLGCKAFQLHLVAALEPVGVPCPEHTCQTKTRGSRVQKQELLFSKAIFQANFGPLAEMSAGQHNPY